MTGVDHRAALVEAAVHRGESLAALSRLIGRNAAYLQQFVTRRSPRRLDECDRRLLSAYLRIDEARLGGKARAPASVVHVPRLDLAASAGSGALIDDEAVVAEMRFDPALLRTLGVRAGDASLVRAAGTSMLPGIADGDLLLVDRARRLTERGGVFVIRLEGTLMVKRLARRRGLIAIRSDNPESPPIASRRPAEVDVLGGVVWLSRAVA